MSEKEITFLSDPKEKARLRLKYFDNFESLREDQEKEKQLILAAWPDLMYFV